MGAVTARDDVGMSPAVRVLAKAVGAEHTGIRISPEHNIQGVLETDRADVTATYTPLADGIADLKPAYLSILYKDPADELVQGLRRRFGGPVLLNTGFGTVTTRDDAIMLLEEDPADAAVVGRPAIANPDLARRWQEDHPLNEIDQATLCTDSAAGYTATRSSHRFPRRRRRRPPAQAFRWGPSVVSPQRSTEKVCALGKVLPEKPVEMLVTAAVPGTLRIGEIGSATRHLTPTSIRNRI